MDEGLKPKSTVLQLRDGYPSYYSYKNMQLCTQNETFNRKRKRALKAKSKSYDPVELNAAVTKGKVSESSVAKVHVH